MGILPPAGHDQTSAWSCADGTGTLTVPAAGADVQVLFWVEGTGTSSLQLSPYGHVVGEIRRAVIESVAI